MVTISDVSRLAGVSRSTVSRVIAGNGYVSAKNRSVIETAIAELGYRPSMLARALRSNRSDVIGAVVLDIGSGFHARMVAGMQAECRAMGKSLMVSSGFADRNEEARAVVELIDRSCDGLIVSLENEPHPDLRAALARTRIPLVVIGADHGLDVAASVVVDNASGAHAAARHLIEHGHREIVHLTGQVGHRDTRERLRGIEAAIAEAGLPATALRVVNGAYLECFGNEATARLIAEGHRFTAILAGDDDIAAGALLALRAAGLRVPQDVSLVGFNDNPLCKHLTPALTTVGQPVDEIGRAAARRLLAKLADPKAPPATVSIPTGLVARGSVSRPLSMREVGSAA